MSKELIPFIIAIMVVYAFSQSLYNLIKLLRKDYSRNYSLDDWISPLLDYLFKGDKRRRERVVQILWTTYWGIASIFAFIYLSYRF